jgi:ribosomal protein L12E/L44/L45/RPP1/RPP2
MATASELRAERRRVKALDLGLRTDDLDDAIRDAEEQERKEATAPETPPAAAAPAKP